MVALLGIRQVAAAMAPGADFETASQTQTTIAFVVFTLPLMCTSIVAGVLADRLSKRTVIITMKAVEVGLMIAATIALFLNPAGGIWPLVVLAGMGVHSAIFSPAKYGILPELIGHERLASGNGLLEMWTFLAILGGTAAGGMLLGQAGSSPWLAPLGLTVIAVIGFAASWSVPSVQPARADGGLAATLSGAWSALRADRMLRMAITGNIFFWTIASLFAQDILVYAKAVLGLSDTMAGLPLTMLSVGIGVGAVLVGRLSPSRVEYGLIPLGAIGVFLTLLVLGLTTPRLGGTVALMLVLGMASGLVFIPLNALIQWRAPADRRGSVIALENTCVFAGIMLGSLAGGALANAGLSTSGIFVATALVTFTGTSWALWLLPDALVRLVLVILTHTMYRVRIVGREHVPHQGGALLVPNHVSFIDGLLLVASLDRPIRFVVDARVRESSAPQALHEGLPGHSNRVAGRSTRGPESLAGRRAGTGRRRDRVRLSRRSDHENREHAVLSPRVRTDCQRPGRAGDPRPSGSGVGQHF